MKRLALVSLLVLAACATSPKPEPKEPLATTSSALSATSASGAAKDEPKQDPKEALDPLSVGTELEASSVPKVEQTPVKELRAKSRGDLDAAMGIVKRESTFDGALKKLTQRLGKPTWTENGKKRVWVAKESAKTCSRFVLDADGEVTVESADTNDWRMLSALAQQNACTGEIRRGVPGSK